MWDPNPSADQVTAYHVCIGTASGSCNKHSNSVGSGQTSFTFTPTPQVLHYVAVRAVNASGQGAYSVERTFSIPALTQPANQSSTVGVAISPLDLVVSDADGSPRQFTHTGLPVGLTLNSATGRITGTPAAAGTHNVTVFVNDGLVTVSRSFTWTVTTGGTVNPTGPALTITSHTSGQWVTATRVTLRGTASDGGRAGSRA
jgi:hypothetical protein